MLQNHELHPRKFREANDTGFLFVGLFKNILKKEAIRCKVKFSTFFFLKLNVLLTFSNGVFISRTPTMLVVKCFSSRFAKHVQKTGLPLFFVSIFSKFFYFIKWIHFYHTIIYIYTLSGNRRKCTKVVLVFL